MCDRLREWALQQGASLLSGTLQVGFGIILAFFLYRDGALVERRLESAMSRLAGWRARRVLQAAGATITSVVNGVLGTALVQGVLLGFSFWLAGIPGAIVLAALGVVLTPRALRPRSSLAACFPLADVARPNGMGGVRDGMEWPVRRQSR